MKGREKNQCPCECKTHKGLIFQLKMHSPIDPRNSVRLGVPRVSEQPYERT